MNGPSDHWITTRVATPIVAAVFALLFLMSLLAYPQVQASFVKDAQVAAKSTLRLVSGAVDQALGKYQPIPGLIADDPIFRDLLHQTGNNGIVPFVNEKLRHIAGSVGASDIYIMDPSGTTVAASNYRDERSFMGNNFAYRPYFYKALAGEATQFHALGTTSGERGFFFSVPILDGISVIGVLALKVTVELLRAHGQDPRWRSSSPTPTGSRFSPAMMTIASAPWPPCLMVFVLGSPRPGSFLSMPSRQSRYRQTSSRQARLK